VTLADVTSLAPTRMKKNPAEARRVFQTVLLGLDRRRFPWVADKREPTEPEKSAAVSASAALIATQKAATDRRNESKAAQENAAKEALKGIGFKEVSARNINTLAEAPGPGEFCGESLIGGKKKSDVVVGLYDRRVLAIECKVSNSYVNSIKRLADAAGKASIWRTQYGTMPLIASAMLSGVFGLKNLVDVQNEGLTLWWAHEMATFLAWIKRASGRG
jgi:hypothetical protein